MNPQMMGLLSAAAAGMEASGPSRTPVSLGQIMSRGLLSGVGAYQGAQDQEMKRGLLGAQLSHYKTQDEIARAELELKKQQRERELQLLQLRPKIFGDPGVSPQQALAGGGGPTNDNAALIRQPNPMALNPSGVQAYLAAGGKVSDIKDLQELGPKWEVKDRFNPETGRSEKVLVDMRNPTNTQPFGGQESKPLHFANVGNEIVGLDQFTGQRQGPGIGISASPGELLTDTRTREEGDKNRSVSIRGQNMADARAGQVFDTDRGVVVNTQNATSRPVMAGATPIGPKPEKLGESAVTQITGVNNLRNAITDYRNQLKTFKTMDPMNPNTRAVMGTFYNNMMLQAKEAYRLGVLNGPDYTILQSVVRDPNSLQGMITSNAALDKQAAELDRIMTKIAETTAAGSRTPRPTITAPRSQPTTSNW